MDRGNGTALDAQQLRAQRRSLRLTQAELAQLLGVSPTTVARWERGERPITSPGSVRLALERLATDGESTPLRQKATALPKPLSSFVGRTRELAFIQRLLESNRLVTVTGTGGVGKTRLALRVAEQVAGRFPDGVTFASLGPITDSDLVPVTIARACGLENGDTTALSELLERKHVLLVLDNFEQVLAAAAYVMKLLSACPRLKVLVTSRAALRVSGEHIFTVPPLELPARGTHGQRGSEAVRLFIDRAVAVKPDFELTTDSARAVAEICRRLDGLPLAIELAAARVRALRPEAILTLLQRPLDLLVDGARDQPPRHQTLRAAIGWSYALLEQRHRELFRRLAPFAGGFSVEAVATVAALGEEAEALSDLLVLVDHGLLRPDQRSTRELRFELLETIWEYAHECLVDSDEDPDTRDRHAWFFLNLAERAELQTTGSDAAAWLDRLECEHDNLRAAISWFAERGDVDSGMRLAVALRNFWLFRGHMAEGDRWLRALLGLPGPPSIARARALSLACFTAYNVGDHARARALGADAISMGLQTGDFEALGSAHQALGVAARERGEYDTANLHLSEAGRWGRAAGDVVLTGTAVRDQAYVAVFQGRLPGAELLAQQAKQLFKTLGFAQGLSTVHGVLGRASFLRGDFAAARMHFERAVRLSRESGEKSANQASLLAMLARVEIGAGRLARARSILVESLETVDRSRNPTILCRCLDAAICLATAQGHPERALHVAGAAAALRQSIGLQSPSNLQQITERELVAARQRLGHRRAQAAWSAGEALNWQAAVAEALAEAAIPPDRLTRREYEIVDLVAAGLSNSEIAERLVIAERTVENHVANVLDKFGVRTRTQIATRVVGQRLNPTETSPVRWKLSASTQALEERFA